MVKKLPAHITFHLCTHHMSLIGYIIFAETLHDVHNKKRSCDHREGMKNNILILCKREFLSLVRRIWGVGKIYQTDNGCTDQVNKKDRFVRAVVVDEFLDGIHRKKYLRFYEMYSVV